MGHLREKYTKDYFLGAIDEESKLSRSVAGFESFKSGKLDKRYKHYLGFLQLKGKTVLDIGFGRGEIIQYCALNGANKVVGIDFSENAWQIASGITKDLQNVELYVLEAKDMSFENEYDIIFLLDVIEHIPDFEMETVYRKIHSALKMDGLVLIQTPFFKSTEEHDHSDLIEATKGMHCNKQTRSILADSMTKNNFHKYSINVWSKTDSFYLPYFIFATKLTLINTILELAKILRKWTSRARHPLRTLKNAYNKLSARYDQDDKA